MAHKPLNAQIVSNGEGQVIVIENGTVVGSYDVEYSSVALRNYLEELEYRLAEYAPYEEAPFLMPELL